MFNVSKFSLILAWVTSLGAPIFIFFEIYTIPPSNIFAILGVVIGVLYYFKKGNFVVKKEHVSILFYLILILLVISIFKTMDIASQDALYLFEKYFLFILIYLVSINLLDDTSMDMTRRLLIIVGGVLGLIAVYQSVTVYIPHGVNAAPHNFVGPFLRAGLGLDEKNFFASTLVTISFITLGELFTTSKRSYKFILLLIYGLVIAGVIFTFSRGALISLIASMLTFFYMLSYIRKRLRYVISFLAALPVLFTILALTTDAFDLLIGRIINSTDDNQAISRLTQMEMAFDLFNPLTLITGFGLGNFKYLNGYYVMHNTFFALWVELGLLALIIFVCIFIICFKRLFFLVKNGDENHRIIAASIFACFVAFTIQGLTIDGSTRNTLYLLILMISIYYFSAKSKLDAKVKNDI